VPDERDVTDALPPFADVVVALAAVDPAEVPEGAMDVDRVHVSFPVELEVVRAGNGRVDVRGSPPLLYTKTSFTPVFHQLTLRFVSGSADGA
jgi:hypothetical protein